MSRRIGPMKPMRRAPDPRRFVGTCMTCRHWQIDFRPGGVSDFDGWQAAFTALAEVHLEHLGDCPGAGGRVKFDGQWIDPPQMSDGHATDGSLEMTPLPAWWVTR